MFQIRSMIGIAFFILSIPASSDDFRRENEKKILRVYDQILKNVEMLNNSNSKLTEDEKANRVYSFLANKKGDGFWFASACRVSYDVQLIVNKHTRGKKDLFWDDDDFLKRKRLFYKAILEHNIHLLGESQFETSHQLAQKETKIYFFDFEKQELMSAENVRSEKLNQYLYQCNRLSSVFDNRQLPPLPEEEKNISKNNVTDNNSLKQNSSGSVTKSINPQNMKKGIEYVFRPKDQNCTNSDTEFCISEPEYQSLCSNAALSDWGARILTQLNSRAHELYLNGDVEDLKIYWATTGVYKCRVKMQLKGIIKGSSRREVVEGAARKFQLGSEGKVMITFADSMN